MSEFTRRKVYYSSTVGPPPGRRDSEQVPLLKYRPTPHHQPSAPTMTPAKVGGLSVDANAKALELDMLNFQRPYMRGFHGAWMGFFCAFLGWFAFVSLAPLAQMSRVCLA
jgi:hypothetical protein